MGQVAGPNGGRRRADAHVRADHDLGVLHVAGDGLFDVARCPLALVGDEMGPEPDRKLVAVGGLARLADGHDHAAPVGVFSGDGRLQDRRVGAGERNPARGRPALGAFDLEGDELGEPFPVLGDLYGEILHEVVQRAGKGREARIVRAGDRLLSAGCRGAGGKEQAGVAGRGVAVDRHAVEGRFGVAGHQRLQGRRRDGRIGEDEAQHRRHVRGDHAGALAEAVDRDGDTVDLDAARGELGVGVRGHDGTGGRQERVGLGALCEAGEEMGELLRLERLPDDACRGHVDLGRRAADGAGGGFRRQARRVCAAAAGEGIGVARVDDKRACLAALQALAAPQNRRGAGLGARENAGGGRPLGEAREHQIGAAPVADAGLCRGERHALDRRQRGQGLRCEGGSFAGARHGRCFRKPANAKRARSVLGLGLLAVDELLDLGIHVLDLRLAAKIHDDLLGLEVDHGHLQAVLDGLERGRLAFPAAVQLDDVPAELRLEGL